MSAVEVSLGEVVVGMLSRDDDTYGSHRFVFDANYVSRPRRPLLGQIFEDWIPDEKTKDNGILPWFDHLLPLAHLPQRKAIARDAGIDPDDDLAMLAWLGDDLLGAVRMRVIEATPFRSRRAVAPLVQASEDALYRASLPGAQWKLSLAEGYKGLTLPLKGAAGAWIAKFHSDIVRDAVAREYATMTWARHAGLDVPEIRMVSVDDIAGLPNDVPRGDGGVYLIRRFDRAPKGVRIHTEDFAQILDLPQGPEQFKTSHEAIAHVLAAIAGPCDVRAYLRQVVFCVLAGNGDAHAKNWSVIYRDGRSAALSPAYDLTPTILVEGKRHGLALSLDGGRQFDAVTPDSFAHMAALIGQPSAKVATWARDDAAAAREAWHTPEVQDLFGPSDRRALQRHLDALQL